ncbi:Hypothetical predicted protein [Pelobates cultripes]|uniref:Uncharacterized protein n=1 Tax=Pelobates cultripes TaxID=61616 RepID=A0AAD1RT13_PELCU|nr:Hypothetical predicted protein [Pelobates cultripes]
MAAVPDSPGLSSDVDPLDSPDAIPEADDPFSAVQLGDLGAPATKGDILGLLKHLRTWFRTDMALLREEVTAITDRVKATEEDITSMAQRQSDATERLQQLHGSHQALQPGAQPAQAQHCQTWTFLGHTQHSPLRTSKRSRHKMRSPNGTRAQHTSQVEGSAEGLASDHNF